MSCSEFFFNAQQPLIVKKNILMYLAQVAECFCQILQDPEIPGTQSISMFLKSANVVLYRLSSICTAAYRRRSETSSYLLVTTVETAVPPVTIRTTADATQPTVSIQTHPSHSKHWTAGILNWFLCCSAVGLLQHTTSSATDKN